MNKPKGFTLIELLAVILILGIIALIAIPVVSNIIKDSKKGAFETTVNNIVGAVEDECSMQTLKGEPLTTSYTFTSGAISPTLSVKGNLPETGTITVDSNCKTTVNVNDGTFSALKATTENSVTTEDGIVANATYSKGAEVYFNPESGLKCDDTAYNANTGASNNGTKTGCMKWYVYSGLDISDLSVNMILDHNTTAQLAWNSTGSNSVMKEVATALASDTSTWNSALNTRLITANEIATITEYAGWTTSSTWYYFASGTSTVSPICTTGNITGCTYRWLYDRTSLNSATTYGALNNASGTTFGYWTSSAHASDSNSAWYVHCSGYLSLNIVSYTASGVRPVITVAKSLIS